LSRGAAGHWGLARWPCVCKQVQQQQQPALLAPIVSALAPMQMGAALLSTAVSPLQVCSASSMACCRSSGRNACKTGAPCISTALHVSAWWLPLMQQHTSKGVPRCCLLLRTAPQQKCLCFVRLTAVLPFFLRESPAGCCEPQGAAGSRWDVSTLHNSMRACPPCCVTQAVVCSSRCMCQTCDVVGALASRSVA
jgi:hypothetical protein